MSDAVWLSEFYNDDLIPDEGPVPKRRRGYLARVLRELLLSPFLPQIDEVGADRICELLIANEGMNRPPRQAARWLAFLCELDMRRMPYPRRAAIERHLRIPIPTLDSARSAHFGRYFTIINEAEPGNIQGRPSTTTGKYYKPSEELRLVYFRLVGFDAD